MASPTIAKGGRQLIYEIVALTNSVCLQFDLGYASHKRKIERIASPGFVHSLLVQYTRQISVCNCC